MSPRTLEFESYDDLLAEVDRLYWNGYTKLGRWDLAQILDHLDYFIQGSLNGYHFRVPWLVKALFGRRILRKILATRSMRSGVPTPQKPLPAPGGDDARAVERFNACVQHLRAHRGAFHDSPFFGELSSDEWRELHLIHAAHHLGFLQPKR